MKRGEKGFTLIEVAVVVFIMALIASGATMTIAQVLGITKDSNNRTTAIRQVQSAGYWISRDSLMAKKLKRQHLVYDINGLEIENDMMYIAQNIIDSASFSVEDGVWILSIGARSGTKTENREYEIIPRVEGYRLI
jgi:prepilin-type N-terminal cleavage/methylation domain-containing protein